MRLLPIIMMSLLTAVAADDPGGWTAAKWGMTDDQLLAAFPGQAARLDPPDAGAHVHIKPLQLSGADFHVLFQSDKDGRLTSVLLSPIGQPPQGYDLLFQSLQNLLSEKYGRPWKSDSADKTEFQWSLKTTIISLSRIQIAGLSPQIINLHYRQKPADLDKM